jgi:hypothetical protein
MARITPLTWIRSRISTSTFKVSLHLSSTTGFICHFVSSVRAPFVWQVWWSQYSWNIVESSASLKPIGSIAPNWTSRLKDPHRRYLLSAVQVHATTHCRFFREQHFGPRIFQGRPWLKVTINTNNWTQLEGVMRSYSMYDTGCV